MLQVKPGEQDLAATLLQRRDLDLKGVRIKDGETLVIGGMNSENETKSVNKIPFLGDLPVIGMFSEVQVLQNLKNNGLSVISSNSY